MGKWLYKSILVTLIVTVILPARANDSPVVVDWGVRIPMSDGTELNATIYRPANSSTPLPTIFTLTPYVADSYHDRAMFFAANGYVFASIDVRGRGNSQGEYTPQGTKEGQDGAAIVRWLADQPFCDGRVAMWGGSNAGWNQWMTAGELPDALRTIVPIASPAMGIDYPSWNGVAYSFVINWLALTGGRTMNNGLFWSPPLTDAIYRRYYEHLPWKSLANIAAIDRAELFEEWLDHPLYDDYWRIQNPSDSALGRMNLPILTITGYYDGNQIGALWHFKRHIEANDSPHYLLIGPWDHAGTRSPQADLGGRHFAENSVLDMNSLHLAWYDWVFKQGVFPELLKEGVTFYVPGLDEWRHAPDIDSMMAQKREYFLSAPGDTGTTLFNAGTLATERPESGSATYRYDPLQTLDKDRLEDNGEFLVGPGDAPFIDGDALIFHTPPFLKRTILGGQPSLELWLRLDVPDTDLAAMLYLVNADGSVYLQSMDIIRLRHRDGLDQERLWQPGNTERIVLDDFMIFADVAEVGSRIRLVVFSPNHPRRQKNYNTAMPVALQSGADAKTANVTIFAGGDHASRLVIPLEEIAEK